MVKITLTDMRDAIALHFVKKGQKLTNLNKAALKNIEAIVKKYKLNMEELLTDLNENREECKIIEQERKAEQSKRDAEYKKIQEEKLEKKLMMWSVLTEEDKLKVKDEQYKRYVKETEEENISAKIITDKMYEMYKREGLPSFSLIRESENVLIVKGVHIHNGFFSSVKTKEEYEQSVTNISNDYDYHTAIIIYNEDLILNLYETEMLKNGFSRDEKDGDFYKMITVKDKKDKKDKKNNKK
jgi:hypothetical protein